MASCYRCNADLPKGVPIIRQSVKMGASSGVSWGRRFRSSSRSSYSEKPFCQACVALMAAQRRSSGGLAGGCLAVVLGGGAFVVLIGALAGTSHQNPTPPPAVLATPQAAPPDMAKPKPHRRKKMKTTPKAEPKADKPSELMELE